MGGDPSLAKQPSPNPLDPVPLPVACQHLGAEIAQDQYPFGGQCLDVVVIQLEPRTNLPPPLPTIFSGGIATPNRPSGRFLHLRAPSLKLQWSTHNFRIQSSGPKTQPHPQPHYPWSSSCSSPQPRGQGSVPSWPAGGPFPSAAWPTASTCCSSKQSREPGRLPQGSLQGYLQGARGF